MAGNELDQATSTVFVKDPFNGVVPQHRQRLRGHALDVPAGSVVHDVVFFLYQQAGGGQQLCAVQLYHPGATGYEILLSHVAAEDGIVAVSTRERGARRPAPAGRRRTTPCARSCGGASSRRCAGASGSTTARPGGGIGGPPGAGSSPSRPARVYDSRQNGGKLPPARSAPCRWRPALDGRASRARRRASAAAITLTVTDTEGSGGYVAVFPAGGTWSGTSSVNWFGAGQNLATAAIVALGPNRDLVLRGGAASPHVIVDVTGYVA